MPSVTLEFSPEMEPETLYLVCDTEDQEIRLREILAAIVEEVDG